MFYFSVISLALGKTPSHGSSSSSRTPSLRAWGLDTRGRLTLPAAPMGVPAATSLPWILPAWLLSQLWFLCQGATLRLPRWHQRRPRTVNLSVDALLPFPNFPLSTVGAEITTLCFSSESRNINCSFLSYASFPSCAGSFLVSWIAWIPGTTHRTDSGKGDSPKLLSLPWVLCSDQITIFLLPKSGQVWSGQS